MKSSKEERLILEERLNWITHAFGLGLSIIGFILLVVLKKMDDYKSIISIIIYGSSLVILYSASTLYHAIAHIKIKKLMQLIDHCAIYLKIAGTYTPFALLSLTGNWSFIIITLIWGLAIGGVIFKLLFPFRFNLLSTIIYLLMGWVVLIAIVPIFKSLPLSGFICLASGGIAFTAGIVFFLWEKLPFSHAIWHLFVMTGSFLHYITIFFFVTL